MCVCNLTILFSGQIKKICEQTPQTDGPVIGVSPTQCKYGKLRNALWIGVGPLSAVIQDQENSKLYELIMCMYHVTTIN